MAFVNLGQIIYPVGAIYASVSSTNPGSLFGGGWAEITGAVLRGNKQAGVYSDSDTCTLTANQMPKHSHNFSVGRGGAQRESVVCGDKSATFGGGSNGWTPTGSVYDAFIVATGGGQAHTNKQRSYNVYMWRRTS